MLIVWNKTIIKNNKLSRLVFALAGICIVGFIIANILAYQHAHAMMTFSEDGSSAQRPEDLSSSQKLNILLTGVKLARPMTNKQPVAVSRQCEAMQISNGQNDTLGVWYCPVSHADRLVILFHGYLKDKSSLINEAKFFLQAKHSVLLIDFRGSGGSSAAYTTIGYHEGEDVAAAVKYAKQHFPHNQTILYGQSMGAAAILRAVYSHQVIADAIIVEAVFDRLLSTIKNRFQLLGVPAFPGAQLLTFWGGWQAGFDGFAHNPVDYAKAVNAPILFLHGENDTRTYLLQGRAVYESVTASKYFSTFPETVHEPLLARHPDKWKQEISFFLQAEL